MKITASNIKRQLLGFGALLIFTAIAVAVLMPAAGSILPSSLTPQAHAQSLPAYNYTKTFDTTNGLAWSNGVTTDKNGNVYVTGGFNGTVIFDGSGGTDSVTSANSSTFITKYNVNGTYAWTKTFDTSAHGAYANGYSITTDTNGNIYVTGYFQGTVVFDGPGGTDSVTSASSSTFITKYNASGTYSWTKTFDTSAAGTWANGKSITTDKNGNIYVTGEFNGTVIFDGPGGTDSVTSANDSAFITKYNANGTYAWTKTFDATATGAYAYGTGIATDSNGNIYVTGLFSGTITFDGPGGTDTSADESNAMQYLTKYNTNGTYAWTKYQTSSDSNARVCYNSYACGSVAVNNATGQVFYTSDFTGTITFDGPGGTDSQTAAGGSDMFLTSYTAFVPDSGDSNSSSGSGSPSSSAPGAPNTGYGTPDNFPNAAFFGLSSVALVSIACGLSLLYRQKPMG